MDKFAKARTAGEVSRAFRDESLENERLYREAEARHEIADMMANMRVTTGISQSELARRVGRAQPFIARLEKGAYERCGLPTLRTFARALGFDVDFGSMFKPISEARYSEQSSCEDIARICRLEEIAGETLHTLSASWGVRETPLKENAVEAAIESKEAAAAA